MWYSPRPGPQRAGLVGGTLSEEAQEGVPSGCHCAMCRLRQVVGGKVQLPSGMANQSPLGLSEGPAAPTSLSLMDEDHLLLVRPQTQQEMRTPPL